MLNLRTKEKKEVTAEEKFFVASQWELMWRKFTKHRLAAFAGLALVLIAFVSLFCEFFSTQNIYTRDSDYIYCPPQRIHFYDGKTFSLRPFVYDYERSRDPETLRRKYKEDRTRKYPLYLFVRGDEYELWGLFSLHVHFVGTKEGPLFLFGTDKLGRDMFSRVLYAARISLSIGLVGVALSFVLGCLLGGISGYYGGKVDMIIQRIIEFLLSIPTIPLWMALSAAMPADWSPMKVYFGITIILAIRGWCYLGRVVRGKILELREEDFSMAAKISGARDLQIIIRHLLPAFFSYLIVHLTLSIPRMILGETALSFLGLGIRPPIVSWGVLLKNAQNFRTVALHPWLLVPGIFVVVAVLIFNFVGDGLRDAADPYK